MGCTPPVRADIHIQNTLYARNSETWERQIQVNILCAAYRVQLLVQALANVMLTT